MNTVVCELNDWGDLPYWLGQLKAAIEQPKARTAQWSFAVRAAGTESQLDICGGEPPVSLASEEALAIVAHRTGDNRPEISESAQRLISGDAFAEVRFDGGSHVVKAPQASCFAVSARITGSKESAVDEAVRELLQRGSQYGFRTLHLQLPGDGNVPAVYAFMETVRTFGRWQQENPQAGMRLRLYVLPEVIENLMANRIDVHELLTSELIRFWVFLYADGDAEPERRVFYYPPAMPFRAVLDDLDVQPSDAWFVSLQPAPRWPGDAPAQMTTFALADRQLSSMGVAFGSVLTIQRAAAQSATAGS